MDIFLHHGAEYALELRHAPPSHAWLAACRRCRGPEILFAFFDDLKVETETDSAALDNLLRKFQSQGSQRITDRGGRVLLIVDGPELATDEAAFIYLDRRRYADGEPAKIQAQVAKHVICEHGRVIERGWDRCPEDDVLLESVWLPKATSVGEQTFCRCRQLVRVSLPVIESIGKSAFWGCNWLRSVSLDAQFLGDSAFACCSRLRTVSLPYARFASKHLFNGLDNLESVSMPIATEVRQHAFRNCSNLTEVSLPAVRHVAISAFLFCDKLEAVSFPRLESVHRNAFSRCRHLSKERIFVPEHVKNTLPDSFEEDDEEEEVSTRAEEDGDDDDY